MRHSGPVKLRLCGEDLELGYWIGEQRNINEQKLGANTFREDQDSLWTNQVGATGEVVVARYHGVDPDTHIEPVGGGRPWDLDIEGRKIEVKSSTCFFNVHLMVAKSRMKPDPEYYFRVCINMKTGYAHINGFQTREYVKASPLGYWQDNTKNPLSYIVPERELIRCRLREEVA